MILSLLQAARVKTFKADFISCPSCGRTHFDLQTATAKIKMKTEHLKGVKIGIMGCVVNGPGEMADADFGYVGSGSGKISLYRGQNCVRKNIPEEKAVDYLIELIQEHGMWQDQPETN
jgi:(E)-4-hydroxy-3-methylbut-2-enyl-diphosphate synthase